MEILETLIQVPLGCFDINKEILIVLHEDGYLRTTLRIMCDGMVLGDVPLEFQYVGGLRMVCASTGRTIMPLKQPREDIILKKTLLCSFNCIVGYNWLYICILFDSCHKPVGTSV